ncbi:MAG: hypothetical protein U0350_06300 [Caldilineaceae bacterium]
MSLVEIHTRLSSTATLFTGALALWALFLRFRAKPLDGNWLGAAVIGEVVLLAQSLLGFYLYLQGGGTALPRPFLHILYGIVSIITLPAAYGYFNTLDDENVKTLAMAAACIFLWGIILRASYVAEFAPPI